MSQMINKVICGDIREVIKSIEDSTVDIVFLDPLFDEYQNFYEMIEKDIPRVIRDNGIIISFSNRPHTGELQRVLDKSFKFLTEIVWNFSDGRWVSNRLPRICHENILIYTNGKKNTLNDMRVLEWIEKPKQTKKGGASIGKWESPVKNRVYKPEDYAHLESVIYLPRGTKKIGGIIAKPEKLIDLLLKVSGKEEMTVLDAFSGSGNISLVAKRSGMNYIAVEIDEDKCEVIENRLNGVV